VLVASLLYFRFRGDRLAAGENGTGSNATPAATELLRRTYGIEGDVFELVVTAESPLVGMTLGEAEALHDAR
jgi:Trk K+ transport system NAD-binding subunit